MSLNKTTLFPACYNKATGASGVRIGKTPLA